MTEETRKELLRAARWCERQCRACHQLRLSRCNAEERNSLFMRAEAFREAAERIRERAKGGGK